MNFEKVLKDALSILLVEFESFFKIISDRLPVDIVMEIPKEMFDLIFYGIS